MKFAAIVLLFLALTSASPAYKVEWVTTTKHVTVTGCNDECTAAFPQTGGCETTQTVVPVVPPVDFSETAYPTASTPTSAIPTTQNGTSALQVADTGAPTETSGIGTGEVFSGDGTYYNPGLGACGRTNSDTDFIVAIGDKLYERYTPGSNPNYNTLCGKKLIASYEGKSVEVTVVDRCGSCLESDLDLSPIAFLQIADKLLGRIKLTWKWA